MTSISVRPETPGPAPQDGRQENCRLTTDMFTLRNRPGAAGAVVGLVPESKTLMTSKRPGAGCGSVTMATKAGSAPLM